VQDKRLETMLRGAADLQRWILDALREGLGNLQSQPNEAWDNMAARLTDCKLGALSRRLRILRDRRRDADWLQAFEQELADLYLICSAFAQYQQLSEALQEELLNQGGRTIRQVDLLQQKTEKDTWLVLGKNFGTEEDLRWRRTWLWGSKMQKPALLLDFAFRDEPFKQDWMVGAAFEGNVAYYPGATQVRAALGEFMLSEEPMAVPQSHANFSELADAYAHALRQNPFLGIYPVMLNKVRATARDGNVFLLDEKNQYLPIKAHPLRPWKVLAATATQKQLCFAEWDGAELEVLCLIGESGVVEI
jgi:hypothetical protein